MRKRTWGSLGSLGDDTVPATPAVATADGSIPTDSSGNAVPVTATPANQSSAMIGFQWPVVASFTSSSGTPQKALSLGVTVGLSYLLYRAIRGR